MGYLLRYQSEFTELAKSRFLDCESCGMTQGALIRNVADCQALYMQAKQTRSDKLYMTTLDTGRCSHIYIYIYTYNTHTQYTCVVTPQSEVQRLSCSRCSYERSNCNMHRKAQRCILGPLAPWWSRGYRELAFEGVSDLRSAADVLVTSLRFRFPT